jgi:hypothetical protein
MGWAHGKSAGISAKYIQTHNQASVLTINLDLQDPVEVLFQGKQFA